MIKKLILGLLSVMMAFSAGAQDSTVIHKESIMRDARILAKAMEKTDWEKVIEYTYPPLITMAGGKAKMIRDAKLSDQALKQQNFELKKAELSKPLQELGDDTLFSIIPVRLTFKGPLGNLYSESSFLGVSVDNGSSWKFISMTQVDMNQLLQLFPRLDKQLVFPRKRVYQD